jgi:hypothetical protein
MIFRTNDHYDINYTNDKSTECFICYEIRDEENQFPLKLSNQRYNKKCSCDVFVHDICLKKWYIIHHTCPICRLHMEVTKEQNILYCFIDYCNNTMENILSIIRFIMLFFVIYYIFKRSVKLAQLITVLHYVEETKTEPLAPVAEVSLKPEVAVIGLKPEVAVIGLKPPTENKTARALFGQRMLKEDSYLHTEENIKSTQKWWFKKGTVVDVRQVGTEGWFKVTDSELRGGWIRTEQLEEVR